ncbi:MAG: polysaccharide deacetylase family protein [Steroidobacteraceae bacterium]
MSAFLSRPLLRLAAPGGKRARLMVLTYHRVLERPDPLLPSEPDAERFAAQMAVLATHCSVLPLPEAARRLREGTLPPAAACITFDDGYRNNLDVATPVLQRYGLPATVFVMQNAIEAGIMWNDLVIEAVRRAPATVDLSTVGLGNVSLPPAAGRAPFVSRVLEAFKYRSLQQRWHDARDLYHRIAAEPAPRLMLDESELRRLAQAGIDIGGHTVNHPILATLPEEEARREIVDGAEWLARVVGRRPVSFAYPNGRPGRDFDAIHMQIARKAGFELAVSTEWNCATRESDPYALPRVSFCDSPASRLGWRITRSYLGSWRHPRQSSGP